MRNKILALILFLLLPALAQGAEALTPQQEARAKALFGTLHCVVCSGQSLAGSDAQIARDLRSLVREKISAGESDAEITQYLVARYGEAILMAPPVKPATLPIWLAPLLILGVSSLVAWRVLFRKKSS